MYKVFLKDRGYSKKKLQSIQINGFNKSNFFPLQLGFKKFRDDYNTGGITFWLFIVRISFIWEGELFCIHKYVSKYGNKSPYDFMICEKCKKQYMAKEETHDI